jgi:hypothetical protein
MATDLQPRTGLALGLAGLLALTCGCAGRAPGSAPAGPARAPTPAKATAGGSTTAVDARLAELDGKIAKLEQQLATPAAGTSGRGALAQGSSLRIGAGPETVLERLRRLEQERNAARAEIQTHQARIAALTGELAEARAQGKTLGERADYLARTQESLVAAQQTLAERTAELEAGKALLATSELQRLRGERAYFLLAAAVLKLSPDQLGPLPEIQENIRTQVQESSHAQ